MENNNEIIINNNTEPIKVKKPKSEALSVLLQLQYKKNEAQEMIAKAFKRNAKISSCEDILNEVYRGSSNRGPGAR